MEKINFENLEKKTFFLKNEKCRKSEKSNIFEKSEILTNIFKKFRFFYFLFSLMFVSNLPASLLNRPIKCKETKHRAVQGRLESNINLHPMLVNPKSHIWANASLNENPK